MPDEGAARPTLEVFHLPVARGYRFSILHAPAAARSGRSILYVHPFAEETNKARRMAALQARALAASGWTVLQVDLQGCGDSEGDFANASWNEWVADVAAAAAWLRERSGAAPWLWGLRAGCLLAVEAARTVASVPGLLFWQPVVSGSQHLTQFLRMRLAADALGPGAERIASDRDSTARMRADFLRGRSIEVAGYTLAPTIAVGLDAARLTPVTRSPSIPVIWLELTGSANPALSPASRAQIDAWRDAGHSVDSRPVAGPAFWQTLEIEECPELLNVTLAALEASIARA